MSHAFLLGVVLVIGGYFTAAHAPDSLVVPCYCPSRIHWRLYPFLASATNPVSSVIVKSVVLVIFTLLSLEGMIGYC